VKATQWNTVTLGGGELQHRLRQDCRRAELRRLSTISARRPIADLLTHGHLHGRLGAETPRQVFGKNYGDV